MDYTAKGRPTTYWRRYSNSSVLSPPESPKSPTCQNCPMFIDHPENDNREDVSTTVLPIASSEIRFIQVINAHGLILAMPVLAKVSNDIYNAHVHLHGVVSLGM